MPSFGVDILSPSDHQALASSWCLFIINFCHFLEHAVVLLLLYYFVLMWLLDIFVF